MKEYPILFSDSVAPSESSWLFDERKVKNRVFRWFLRAMRWLDSRVPIVVLYPRRKPQCVLAIEKQLQQRETFPFWSWKDVAVDKMMLENTLKTVAEELRSPNHHFLAGDPSSLVFMAAGYDDIVFLCHRLGQMYDRKLSPEKLKELIPQSTMADVVSFLINK